MKLCHCGKPLHYSDPELEKQVDRLVAKLGEFIAVTVGNKTYNVPRHYIALHGINGADIAKLGFSLRENPLGIDLGD